MPRSSGGGSHSGGYSSSSGSSRSSYSSGGGSHSSGYSSSSSSYGSSSYSYGSSRSYSSSTIRSKPQPKVSSTMFDGATKYVYYRNNRPMYYYSDYETDIVKKHRRLFIWVPLLILILAGLISVLKPAALSTDYDTTVWVSDTLHIIDDENSLFDALEAFRDATGITPCVVTISNESWKDYYIDLSAMAFDIYVNEFEDEKHWLIIYSEPETPDPAFNDWYWEGIQGDETVYIITEQCADDFGITLQRYLTNKKYSVGEAFTMAFNDLTPVVMKNAEVDSSAALGAAVVFALLLWCAIKRTAPFTKTPTRPKSMPAGAKPVKRRAKEINCEYCGGVYLTDHLNCPYCGAGRKAIN